MNIPARYATGYLGDIGVPKDGAMDFSAWFEVYLENRWWTFDARHNTPRIGRVLMAVGRDASDVAITTSFGTADLRVFTVHYRRSKARPPQVARRPPGPPSNLLQIRAGRSRGWAPYFDSSAPGAK